MILDSLILDNIRSYEHEEIMFPKGITLFEGDVGSGKSSILMAIEFALFGFGTMDSESILAKKAHVGYAELGFTVDDQKYEIRRHIERKNGKINQDSKNSYIRVNGEKEPLSATELKQRILKILKFNESPSGKSESRIYRYAVFTPQEEMKSVLENKTKRLETIRKAFGMEDYAKIVANSAVLATAIGGQAVRFDERSRGMEELEKQNDVLREQISTISSEIVNLKKEADVINAKKAESDKKIEQLQGIQVESGRLQSRKDQIEDDIDDYQDRIKSSNAEIEETEKKKSVTKEELDGFGDNESPTKKTPSEIRKEIEMFSEIKRVMSEENTKRDECMKRIESVGELAGKNSSEAVKKTDELQKESENMEKEYETVKKEIDHLKIQETEKKTHVNTLQKEIAMFNDLGAKCPTCEQKINAEEMDKIIIGRNTKIKGFNKELEDIMGAISMKEKHNERIGNSIQETYTEMDEYRQLESKIKEYEAESKNRTEIEAVIAEVNARCEDLKERSGYDVDDSVDYIIDDLGRLKDDLAKYETAAARIAGLEESVKNHEETASRRRAEIEKLETGVAESKKELESVCSKMEAFVGFDSKIESATHERKEIDQRMGETGHKLGSLEENLRNEKQRIADNDEKIEKAKKARLQYKRFSEHRDWLEEFFGRTVSEIEKQVMLSILHRFDDTYRRWYSMLIDDSTKESRIDENFVPIITQDGFEQDVEHLSGGEKTSIALAYRLTLNSLIREEVESLKSNLLILDEPTDGFSKNQLVKVKDVLDELGSQQIILVSHESELEAYADNAFHVVKENGKSRITQA